MSQNDKAAEVCEEIEPMAFRVTGSKAYVDRVFLNLCQAKVCVNDRKDASTIVPLYPAASAEREKALTEKVARLREAGQALANIAFNFSQYEGSQLSETWCKALRHSYQQWDAALQTTGAPE